MSISRADLAAGRVDLSAVSSGERIPDVAPGDILRESFMQPLGLSAKALARDLGVPTNRVTAILHGTRAISADTALRLADRSGSSAEFWMNLQSAHELRCARQLRQAA